MGTLPPAKRAERIRIATTHGIYHAAAIADASILVGVSYHLALALIEGESEGRNIYGPDAGGALSTRTGPVTVAGLTYAKGARVPVTPATAGVFLLMIGAGHTSNGVGPAQITYAGDLPDGRSGGYFRQMLERGLLPWDPTDNCQFGLELLKGNLDRWGDVASAGAHYNGGTHPTTSAVAYGHALAVRDATWLQRFGFQP